MARESVITRHGFLHGCTIKRIMPMKRYSTLGKYIYPVFQYYDSTRMCPEFVPLKGKVDRDLLSVYNKITEYVADQKVTYKLKALPFFEALSTLDRNLNTLWGNEEAGGTDEDYIGASSNLVKALDAADLSITKYKKYFVGSSSQNIMEYSNKCVTVIDDMCRLMNTGSPSSAINDVYVKLAALRSRTVSDLTPLQNELTLLDLSLSQKKGYAAMQRALKSKTKAVETAERNMAIAELAMIGTSAAMTGAFVVGGVVLCLVLWTGSSLTASAMVPVALACTATVTGWAVSIAAVTIMAKKLNAAITDYNNFVQNPLNQPFILYMAINGWLETANRVIRSLDGFKLGLDTYVSFFNENIKSIEDYVKGVRGIIDNGEGKWLSNADMQSLDKSFKKIRDNFEFDDLNVTYKITQDSMVCIKVLAAMDYKLSGL